MHENKTAVSDNHKEINNKQAKQNILRLPTINMGKHKNQSQDSIILNFMEQHHDMARGFVKGDKVEYEELWSQLVTQLNASGPPTRDVTSGKKAWIDWKGNIRRKLAYNKSEAKATGVGPFNKQILRRIEEELAVICGLYTCVEGIPNTRSFGAPNSETNSANIGPHVSGSVSATSSFSKRANKENVGSHIASAENCTNMQNVSSEEETIRSPSKTLSPPPTTPKRKRCAMDINTLLEEENKNISLIGKKLDQLIESHMEDRKVMQGIENVLQDMKSLKIKEVDEQMRHHLQIERSLVTKNEIKLQMLEKKVKNCN